MVCLEVRKAGYEPTTTRAKGLDSRVKPTARLTERRIIEGLLAYFLKLSPARPPKVEDARPASYRSKSLPSACARTTARHRRGQGLDPKL